MLEETYDLSRYLVTGNVSSIDNEVAWIAKSVADFNFDRPQGTTMASFTPLHFATDYLRKVGEEGMETKSDLTDTTVDANKTRIIETMSWQLEKYLYHALAPSAWTRFQTMIDTHWRASLHYPYEYWN